MAKIIRNGWFGKQINVLMVTGKQVQGELIEVSDQYLVIERGGTELQIMAHAIVAIAPGSAKTD